MSHAMSRREKLICDCGGQITRPIPARCPHCGAVFTGVRRALAPAILSILLIAAMFDVLVWIVLSVA